MKFKYLKSVLFGSAAFFFLVATSVKGVDVANERIILVEGGQLPELTSLGDLDVDSFYIGRYPVTWGEWKAVRGWAARNGYDIGGVGYGCTDEHPVVRVNWYDMVKWCNAKSEMEDLQPVYTVDGAVYRTDEFGHYGVRNIEWNRDADGYRLLAEEEWEFAARGGNRSQGYRYAGSDDPDEVAWHYGNSTGSECAFSPFHNGRGLHPVGKKLPNELGIYDMIGNVQEWVWDTGPTQYSDDPIVRGGSWVIRGVSLDLRWGHSAVPRNHTNGFRVSRNASSN